MLEAGEGGIEVKLVVESFEPAKRLFFEAAVGLVDGAVDEADLLMVFVAVELDPAFLVEWFLRTPATAPPTTAPVTSTAMTTARIIHFNRESPHFRFCDAAGGTAVCHTACLSLGSTCSGRLQGTA